MIKGFLELRPKEMMPLPWKFISVCQQERQSRQSGERNLALGRAEEPAVVH